MALNVSCYNKFVWLVKGDTRPVLEFTAEIGCETESAEIIDLTDCTVFFIFKKAGSSTYKFRRECVVTDPTNGKCQFQLQTGDIDQVGNFNGELEINFPDTTIQTSRLIHFKVRDELG